METNLLQFVLEHGLIGGAFLFLLWTNHKREEKLMQFCDNMGKEIARISQTLVKLENKLEKRDRND